MSGIQPGDVAIALFTGAHRGKHRPAVVVSTDAYHAARPDVILSLLTTQVPRVMTAFDYPLQDWAAAGLHQASVFRLYLETTLQAHVTVIGHLSDGDWREVQVRLRLGLAVT